MKSIFGNLELIFKRFATKLGDSRADETDSLVGFIMCINSLLLLSRVCSNMFYIFLFPVSLIGLVLAQIFAELWKREKIRC